MKNKQKLKVKNLYYFSVLKEILCISIEMRSKIFGRGGNAIIPTRYGVDITLCSLLNLKTYSWSVFAELGSKNAKFTSPLVKNKGKR